MASTAAVAGALAAQALAAEKSRLQHWQLAQGHQAPVLAEKQTLTRGPALAG